MKTTPGTEAAFECETFKRRAIFLKMPPLPARLLTLANVSKWRKSCKASRTGKSLKMQHLQGFEILSRRRKYRLPTKPGIFDRRRSGVVLLVLVVLVIIAANGRGWPRCKCLYNRPRLQQKRLDLTAVQDSAGQQKKAGPSSCSGCWWAVEFV